MNQEQASSEPMGELGRLTGVLFDPKPAFADIAARPVRWWAPLLLLSVITVGFLLLFSERVGWERFFQQQLQQNPRTREMSAEQREQIMRQQLAVTKWVAPIIAPIQFGVATLVVAGVFLFVFNILAGSQLTFRPVFAVTCYSYLPFAVAGLLAMAMMFVGSPEEFDLQNPVFSNLGVFFDPVESPVLFALAKSFDVFVLWVLLLLATGISAAGRRLSWGKAFTWVVITWALFVAGRVGWAALWS
jgi:hypothetical protein